MIHDLLLFMIYFSLFAGSSLAKSNMYSGPHTWPEDLLHQHVWALRRLFRRTQHSLHYYQRSFSSLFPLTQTSSTISLKLRFRWFLGHAVISRIYLLEKISVKHIFQGEKGHKKWSLWWWSPFALTVLAPINFALLTFAEFRKSVEWRDQWKYWLKYCLHFC